LRNELDIAVSKLLNCWDLKYLLTTPVCFRILLSVPSFGFMEGAMSETVLVTLIATAGTVVSAYLTYLSSKAKRKR
jgi:hypothetical protein